MRTLERIVFRCRDFDSDGEIMYNLHEYKLGLGPCDKTVVELKAWFNENNTLVILQQCSDGTRQFFEYLSQLIASKVSRYYTGEQYDG